VFAIVGTAVGLILVVAIPYFAGIDESSHFPRSYAIAHGHLAMQNGPGDIGGVCMPDDVTAEMIHNSQLYLAGLFGGNPSIRVPKKSLGQFPVCPGRPGWRFIDTATFAYNSPVPFLPQAVAVRVVDTAGGGVNAMLVAARLAGLVTFLVLGTIAIRRTPRGGWALCAVGLLPITLFQAATVTPDTVTTAMVMLVLSSALRLMSKPEVRLRSAMIEVGVLSVLLGLCKPIYVVLALVYVLTVFGPHGRRERWPIGIPLLAAAAVSAAWQRFAQQYFLCDSRFFGVVTDPGGQVRYLTRHPFSLPLVMARSVYHYGIHWLRDFVQVGNRVVTWPTAIGVICLLALALLAIQRGASEHFVLRLSERLALLGIAAIGYTGIVAGWVVTCSAVGVTAINPSSRLFVPLLPLVAVAASPDRARIGRLADGRIPLAVLLVPIWVAFVATLIVTMP
jgi:uncharacterized membrane protein